DPWSGGYGEICNTHCRCLSSHSNKTQSKETKRAIIIRISPLLMFAITAFCIFLSIYKHLAFVDLMHVFGHKVVDHNLWLLFLFRHFIHLLSQDFLYSFPPITWESDHIPFRT